MPHPPYDLHRSGVHTRDALEDLSLLSDGAVRTWEDLTLAHLNPVLALLYTICCRNWISTTNEDSLQQEQARLVYMVVTNQPVNFRKLVYDQIFTSRNASCSTPLVFPNLVYQLLCFQRTVPPCDCDKISMLPRIFQVPHRVCYPVFDPSLCQHTSLTEDFAYLKSLVRGIKLKISGGEPRELYRRMAPQGDHTTLLVMMILEMI